MESARPCDTGGQRVDVQRRWWQCNSMREPESTPSWLPLTLGVPFQGQLPLAGSGRASWEGLGLHGVVPAGGPHEGKYGNRSFKVCLGTACQLRSGAPAERGRQGAGLLVGGREGKESGEGRQTGKGRGREREKEIRKVGGRQRGGESAGHLKPLRAGPKEAPGNVPIAQPIKLCLSHRDVSSFAR